MSDFLLIRTRWAKRVLKQLDEDSATGPNGLPAKVLKKCAAELATPIARLVRKMLNEGVWPKC